VAVKPTTEIVLGSWCLVLGSWFLVLGAWCLRAQEMRIRRIGVSQISDAIILGQCLKPRFFMTSSTI
jgi:hypothetical protein